MAADRARLDGAIGLAAEHVSWTPTEAGVVIVLDLRSSTYLRLNSSGARLWTELAHGSTRERLAASLRDGFGLDAERADADVAAFLADLRRRDLLTE